MNKKIGIYAGSFDPLTVGHLDIIWRSAAICDIVEVAIGVNPAKNTMFSLEERINQITLSVEEMVPHLEIKISSFQGLLVDYAKSIGAKVLIRGIRSVADYEYEVNLANINKSLAPDIETVFLPTDPQLAIVSSSMVKEVARHNGQIGDFVPYHIEMDVRKKFGFTKIGDQK